MIKKYLQFIKEADETTEAQPVESTEKVDSGKGLIFFWPES